MSDNPSKRKQVLTLILTGLAVVVAAAVIWWSFGSAPSDASSDIVGSRAWYTTDDGKTWFADTASKLIPFQKDGKPAFRVYLHSFDGGATIVATKLERHTQKAFDALTALRAAQSNGTPSTDDLEAQWNLPACFEIKKPGETNWQNAGLAKAVAACKPVDPKNPSAVALPIYP